MATRLQVAKIRDKFEFDSFGNGGRSALTSDGRYSKAYAEWLEHWVATHYWEARPVKVSRIKQERLALFTGKGGHK